MDTQKKKTGKVKKIEFRRTDGVGIFFKSKDRTQKTNYEKNHKNRPEMNTINKKGK
ncbi:MAG: hypothetical protein H7A25_08510 [Leptospiraceae bacterium]|nr:hypothetical protein [Leptospiraceae bacterium]